VTTYTWADAKRTVTFNCGGHSLELRLRTAVESWGGYDFREWVGGDMEEPLSNAHAAWCAHVMGATWSVESGVAKCREVSSDRCENKASLIWKRKQVARRVDYLFCLQPDFCGSRYILVRCTTSPSAIRRSDVYATDEYGNPAGRPHLTSDSHDVGVVLGELGYTL
jgi:hypothetical protein